MTTDPPGDPMVRVAEYSEDARRSGWDMTTDLPGSLEVRDGRYAAYFDPEDAYFGRRPEFHPLEAVVLGRTATGGNWLDDAAAALGVSPDWVRGFAHGLREVYGDDTRDDPPADPRPGWADGRAAAAAFRVRWRDGPPRRMPPLASKLPPPETCEPAGALERLEAGCDLCRRRGLVVAPEPAGCLTATGGLYAVRPGAAAYHPLEAALVGEMVLAADWAADVRALLGVSEDWVRGFCDGFAGRAAAGDGEDERQGRKAADLLTRSRFPDLGHGDREGTG